MKLLWIYSEQGGRISWIFSVRLPCYLKDSHGPRAPNLESDRYYIRFLSDRYWVGALKDGVLRPKEGGKLSAVRMMAEFPVGEDWLNEAAEGYRQFRGKCKELSEAAVAADPSLTLVRGYYFCPIWNTNEPHWWTISPDGTIHDPTKNQFPSKGAGVYTPFNGIIECEQCGKEMTEDEARENSVGNHAFCSYECYVRCCL